MKAFVTGSTGFIGTRLVEKLVKKKLDVTCLVHDRKKARMVEDLGAVTTIGRVEETDSMKLGMTDADVVFHCAAVFQLGLVDKNRMTKTNIDGTMNVMTLAKSLQVPKIIYCSSTAALGETRTEIATESFTHNKNFTSHYEYTKWAAHQKVVELAKTGLPVIIAMPSAVFGPQGSGPLGEFFTSYVSRKIPAILGSGETKFSMVYVDDVVNGLIAAFEKGKIGEQYLFSDAAVSWNDLIRKLEELTSIPQPTWRVPIPIGLIMGYAFDAVSLITKTKPLITAEAVRFVEKNWVYSSNKAKKELNWTTTPFERALINTIGWYLLNYKPQK